VRGDHPGGLESSTTATEVTHCWNRPKSSAYELRLRLHPAKNQHLRRRLPGDLVTARRAAPWYFLATESKKSSRLLL